MTNPYRCDKCAWEYVWTMGDRVRAVKRHTLAHILEDSEKAANGELSVPDYKLAEYIRERIDQARWV